MTGYVSFNQMRVCKWYKGKSRGGEDILLYIKDVPEYLGGSWVCLVKKYDLTSKRLLSYGSVREDVFEDPHRIQKATPDGLTGNEWFG